eukprot:3152105-Pyramimonas_sp.AAC.1
MSCVTALDLHIAVPRSYDDLTPVGIIPHDWERSIPATPVVFRSGGAMIVNQIAFVIVMLTSDSSQGP